MTGNHLTVNRYIIRLISFAVIIINCAVTIVFVYIWLNASRSNYFEHADFTTFYAAGAIARDGLGARLYDLSLQAEYQAKLVQQDVGQSTFLPFNNPPFTAIPLILFASLPLKSAFYVWTIIQLCLLIWLLALLWSFSQSWSPLERWMMITGIMAFTPLLIDFMLGTFSLLLLLALFQFYIALKNERYWRGAAWLLVVFIKPQIVLLPGILLLGARRWKAIGAAVLLGAGIFLITSAMFGWGIWLDFLKNINSASSNFNTFAIVPAIEYNLKGFLTMLLGDSQAKLINLISLGALFVSFGGIFLLWRGPWYPNYKTFDLKFSLVILMSLIFSLHLNPYDSLLLVLPGVLFYNNLRNREKSGTAFGIFLLCWPLIFLLDFFILNGQIGFHTPFIVMMIFLIWELLDLSRADHNPIQVGEITA